MSTWSRRAAKVRQLVDDGALGGEVGLDLFVGEIVRKVFEDVFDGSGSSGGIGEKVDVRELEVFDYLLVIQDVDCFNKQMVGQEFVLDRVFDCLGKV